MAKKASKILLVTVLLILLLFGGLAIALRYPAFQTLLAHKAADFFSYKLNTKVSIEKVEISFFNKAEFVNFYMEDLNHDTLVSASRLQIKFKVFELLDKQVSISSIKLDNATVHLKRDTSGLTNMAALFGSTYSSTGDTTPKPSEPFTWKIELNKLTLTNTDFQYLDNKGNLDLKVGLKLFDADVKKFSVAEKLIDINKVRLDGAEVDMALLKRVVTANNDTASGIHFMQGGMQVNFQEFALTNSHFRLNDLNSDSVKQVGMDFKHLDISNINLFAENGAIVADTIFADIKLLNAKDRSGFTIENLTTNARVSTVDVTLDKLDITTPNSHITNFLSFKYNDFIAFKNFFKEVKLKAELKDSKLSLTDLNYFIPKLNDLKHNTFYINGDISGSISNLRGKKVSVRTGSNTAFVGDFSTRGLPDFYETSLNLRIQRLSTTVADIHRMYPKAKIPANVNSLGLINFTGSFDGFATDFVTKGQLTTAIGSATTDVNFKYNRETNKSAYSGDLALKEFNLGRFLGDEALLGKVSLTTKIKGKGITIESLNVELDGDIKSITFKGYEYKDIAVVGEVVKKSFSGDFSISDENLVMDFDGKVDLSNKVPVFNFVANIDTAKLQNLNLTKQNISLSGNMISNFSGSNIDNIEGEIKLSNVEVIRDSTYAFINYLTLDARNLSEGRRKLSLVSDVAEGEVVGKFTVKELPKALYRFGKATFTRDYVDTTALERQQEFVLDLRIRDTRHLPEIFAPKLHTLTNTKILAEFNSANNFMKLSLYTPEIKYDKLKITHLDIAGGSTDGDFDFRANVNNLYSGDSLMLDTISVAARTLANSDIQFEALAADKRRFNYADVTAYLTPSIGRAVLRFDTSDVKLANYHWHFNEGNYVLLEGKKIVTNNLIFQSLDQSIYVSSYLKNDTSTSLKLTLANTSISDFTGIFTNKMRDLKGYMNGKIVVEDVFSKPRLFADLVAEDFMLGDQMIGDVNVETNLDDEGKKINLYASVKSAVNKGNYNSLEAKGSISIDPKNPDLKIEVKADHLNLNFLNYPFFERYVKNVRGHAKVYATVYGTLQKPLLGGEVTLVDDTVTVSFLNTTYHASNQKVRLDEHGFDMNGLVLYDVDNNVLYGGGRINHESFKKFNMDLQVNTARAQFLNTTEKHNPNFYGVAYGSGNVTFSGPFNLPVIVAKATTAQGTWCRLPVTSSYETNKYGFYKFVNPNTDTVNIVTQKDLKLNGLDFKLQLQATPDARMDIILDPVTGDILTTYGSGPITIAIPRNGNLTINGNYEIERGSYLFTLQSVINKKFDINRGGSIQFSGSVYKAAINVAATYDLRTSTQDLISNLLSTSNTVALSASQSRIPVKLTLLLTGILEKPTIGFDIKVIDPDPTIRSYIDQQLTLLKNNETELNKQVFGLLVMNRFIPQSTTTTNAVANGSSIGGTAANTVTEFLTSQLSNYISNLLDYTQIKNLDIKFGYKQYDQATAAVPDANNPGSSTTPAYNTRRELQLALSQRLLNNRLVINAGGNLDIGNSTVVDGGAGTTQSGAKAVIPTGDFQIEYLLTPDGVWRAKAFNRTNYDYYNSRSNNRTGVGISYRQEFDKPSDIVDYFKGKAAERKKKRQENKRIRTEAAAAEEKKKALEKEKELNPTPPATNP